MHDIGLHVLSIVAVVTAKQSISCDGFTTYVTMAESVLHVYSSEYPISLSVAGLVSCDLRIRAPWAYVDVFLVDGALPSGVQIGLEPGDDMATLKLPSDNPSTVVHLEQTPRHSGVRIISVLGGDDHYFYVAYHLIVHSYGSRPDCFHVDDSESSLDLYYSFAIHAALFRTPERMNENFTVPMTCEWKFSAESLSVRVDTQVDPMDSDLSINAGNNSFRLLFYIADVLEEVLEAPNSWKRYAFKTANKILRIRFEIDAGLEATVFMRLIAYVDDHTPPRCDYNLSTEWSGQAMINWEMGKVGYKPLSPISGDRRFPYLPNQNCTFSVDVPPRNILRFRLLGSLLLFGDFFHIIVDGSNFTQSYYDAYVKTRISFRFITDIAEGSGGAGFDLEMIYCDCFAWNAPSSELSDDSAEAILIPGNFHPNKLEFTDRNCPNITCTWTRNSSSAYFIDVAWILPRVAAINISVNGKYWLSTLSFTTTIEVQQWLPRGDVEITYTAFRHEESMIESSMQGVIRLVHASDEYANTTVFFRVLHSTVRRYAFDQLFAFTATDESPYTSHYLHNSVIYVNERLTLTLASGVNWMVAARSRVRRPRLAFYSPNGDQLLIGGDILFQIQPYGDDSVRPINLTRSELAQNAVFHSPWHFIRLVLFASKEIDIVFVSDVDVEVNLAVPALCFWTFDTVASVIHQANISLSFAAVAARGSIEFVIETMIVHANSTVFLQTGDTPVSGYRLDKLDNGTIVQFAYGGQFRFVANIYDADDRFRISFRNFTPSHEFDPSSSPTFGVVKVTAFFALHIALTFNV